MMYLFHWILRALERDFAAMVVIKTKYQNNFCNIKTKILFE
jgi:hypothetical protein